MSTNPHNKFSSLLAGSLLALPLLLGAPRAEAAIADVPLFLTIPVPPMAIINMSKDHQLFYKAYNDFSDLNDDGTIETSYNNAIDYYGYFNNQKCYAYDSAQGRFEPSGAATTHYCSGAWSGNFLNWAAMSRMDVVRKILYGGKRVVDSASETVLERAYLPTDAHSWAKYYNGADIAQLTPFTGVLNANPAPVLGADTTPTDFTVTDASGFQPGDQVSVVGDDLITITALVSGVDTINNLLTLDFNPGSVPDTVTYDKWSITNLSRTGISFCNTTYQASGNSQTSASMPLLRVAQGNFALWSANERWQCNWSEVRSRTLSGSNFSNGNRVAFSLLSASAENPSKSIHGLGEADYTVRVEVCPGTTFSEGSAEDVYGCKQYPDGNLKPVGLLQEFGDEDLIQFGLFTGSYDKNISGGVLRKAVSSFTTEVNEDTNGTFTGVGGIVETLDALRIYGYDYADGTYLGSSGDNCNFQLTSITEGDCRSWGNPMSEIYLESLRYLAGAAATPAFDPGASGADVDLGLTLVSPWSDPLSDANYCAPLNVLNFNASVSSYDNDDLGGFSDLGASSTAAELTSKVIGADENINGADWFVGNTTADSNDLCSAKTVGGLGEVFGLCPEAPASEGTYLMSGISYYAHTNRIRSDLDVPNSDAESLKVTTYGVALATNVPRIDIPVPGSVGKTVTILPAYRLDRSSAGLGFGSGGLVDFKVVQPYTLSADGLTGTGRFYVNWEDSEQGGDYDQDMWGVIAYEITSDRVLVATKSIAESTNQPQGFGYIISGTTQDGSHFHSGIEGFNYTDPTNIAVVVDDSGTPATTVNTSGGCKDCKIDDPATIGVYEIGGAAAGVLKDPLWYTAKYGGFVDDNDDDLPDQTIEWDEDGNGEPDTFFFATNPLKLEEALRDAFKGVAETQSSAASVATNSTRLDTETVIYQARFDSKDWTGQLLAFDIIDTGPDAGQVGDVVWDAGEKIEAMAPAARDIYTYNPTTDAGVSFAWLNLDTTQQGYLNTDPVSGTADTLGSDRLDYVRGDHSDEEQNGGAFRNRSRALADIVNSDPFFVSTPDFRYFLLRDSSGAVATDGAAYTAFRTSASYQARPSVVYIGGNDGMLHAFVGSDDPGTGGSELFAYLPNIVFENLNDMTAPDYNDNHKFFVDGSPRVGDAYFGGAWHSVLVGGLGAGGKGIYALDVTDPANFTATDVLWEFGAADDADLGFTFAQPTIVRLEDDNWYVLLANGYGSSTGTATLYLLNIADGSIAFEFTLDPGTGNGLSAPIPVDIDGDRTTDLIYAGDLKGNLWKVTVDGNTTSQWGSAFTQGNTPEPLFTATDAGGVAQPITSRPDVGLHPEGGYIVLFGTGKYFETTDNVVGATPQVQTFYGIRDDTTNQVTRSELQAQTIEFEGPAFGLDIRVVSDNDVDYTTQAGWYLDLDSPAITGTEGERVVANPLLRGGRIIFTTLIPSPATQPCDFGGTSWLMEMDAISGKRLNESVFDLNDDGVFDESDFAALDTDNDGVIDENLPISGQRSEIGIIKTPGIVSAGSTEYKYLSGSSGTIDVVTESGSSLTGRQSWRQIR